MHRACEKTLERAGRSPASEERSEKASKAAVYQMEELIVICAKHLLAENMAPQYLRVYIHI